MTRVYSIVLRGLYSRIKINVYAARGPRNQTGSFYSVCQSNVTTQTHVSFQFITLYLIVTAQYKYRKLEQRN